MMTWLRGVLIATLCLLAGTAATVIVAGRDGGSAPVSSPVGSPVGAAQPDLNQLSEAMLIDESVVPELPGTSWGRMVAVPRGAEPQVSPAGCELFLSQGAASQKGLAMRSSRNAAIGVAVSVTERRPDLAELVDRCRVFTYEGPNAHSVVTLGPLNVGELPDGAIATLMHCTTTKPGQTLAWDIALVAGFHRGVLVSAEYTPGPQGGPFDDRLAAGLVDVYRAQITGLDR